MSSSPARAASRPLQFPPFEVRRLDNGLRVYAARIARLPLVRMDLLIPAGAFHDGADHAGLATLTTALLDEGLPGSTATEIAEQLGGSLYTGATWNTAVANVTLLSEHRLQGIRLLARVVLEATFPEREVERLRHQRLANLQQRRRVPQVLAERALARALYGSTAYGRPLYGTMQSIGALTRDDFLELHRRHYAIGGMALVAAGDFVVDDLLRDIEETFSSTPTRPPAPHVDLTAPSRDGRTIHIVDVASAPQVQLRLGHAGPPYAHPQFTLAEMMNSILGGRSTSRINLRLRETLGYTYGVQSHFAGRLGPGPFEISTAVAPSVSAAAVTAILEEIDQIRRQPVQQEELEDTRQYLLGQFVNQLQTVEGMVNKLSMLAVFDLHEGHFERYLQTIADATEDDLLWAAQTFLDPSHIAIVAAGPASVLQSQLEPFGPVEVRNPLADSDLWP